MSALSGNIFFFPWEVNLIEWLQTHIGDAGISLISYFSYDLYKISERITINDSLNELFHIVREERKKRKTCVSAQDGINIRDCIREIISKDIFKKDYEAITKPLIFDKGAFIVPEGIIANNQSSYIQLRKMMIENGLYAVVGLHPYVFKPYSGVSTLVLFFDKRYKNRGEIYLRMIEEDVYEKGEGRLPTPDKNDIPLCVQEIEQFQRYLSGVVEKDALNLTGTVVTSELYDENYDFHPYSYYEKDPEPTKSIGKIFNIQKGTVQSSKREEGDYTFITASDTWLTHNEFTHDCEALIFVFGAGGSLGKVHYINGKFVTSDLCFVLTPKDPKRINMKYYYAYFTSHRKEIVQRLARGTNKKAINDARLKTYAISYPEKDEQDRVGNEVQDMFDRVEALKKQIEYEYAKLANLI